MAGSTPLNDLLKKAARAFAFLALAGTLALAAACNGKNPTPAPGPEPQPAPTPTPTPSIAVSGVSIKDGDAPAAALALKEGDTKQLAAEALPADATNKAVVWSSNNEAVATVSAQGEVTARREGAATITVTTQDGNKTADLSLTVSGPAGWRQALANAPFAERIGHAAVAFDGKLWVIGGSTNRGNDVWSSSDGFTWTEVARNDPAAARFSARSRHAPVAFDGKLWAIGGSEGLGSYKNDVWSSSDGFTWVEVAENDPTAARFSARSSHRVAVFKDKLWVIGGWDGEFKNDVWSSADGAAWVEVTKDATDVRFSARTDHEIAAFDGKLWVIGGRNGASYLNDVWSSADGLSWTEVAADNAAAARFARRSRFAAAVLDNKLWVAGGITTAGLANDLWSSLDGATWVEVTKDGAAEGFQGRNYLTLTTFDGKLWVIGGNSSSTVFSDVWRYRE